MLTKTQLEKYRLLYRNKFGKEISSEQALKEGLALVALVRDIALLKKERNSMILKDSKKFQDNN